MTLTRLEYFAGMALNGLLASETAEDGFGMTYESAAKQAVRYAHWLEKTVDAYHRGELRDTVPDYPVAK